MSEQAPDFFANDDGSAPEVPDFELIRPIGQGGFGQVWLATNQTTGHLRAVKVIPLRRSAGTDPAGREIMSITRLEANLRRRHANLLHIHHVGKTDEHLFYVMSAADDASGRPASSDPSYRPATLESRLAGGPLEPEECLRCARQLLRGLASLHTAGMVHRDVKPSNCLFVDGELKLADFGLLTEAHPQVSRMGTQKYMPPDGRMDTRADVYAAGLVIYEMISGLPAESFPRLGERAGQVAANPILCSLTRLALGACQPDPQQRSADARQMLVELDRQPQATARRTRFRRRMVASVAGVLILLAMATAVFWPSPPERTDVNFITEAPFFEATIYLDGRRLEKPDGTPYTTPCTVEDLPATVHQVVFKRQGLPELAAGEIDFTKTRQIVARWSTESHE